MARQLAQAPTVPSAQPMLAEMKLTEPGSNAAGTGLVGTGVAELRAGGSLVADWWGPGGEA